MVHMHSLPDCFVVKERINWAICESLERDYSFDFCGDMTTAWELFEIMRSKGGYCCLKIDSDYDYTYGLKLYEDPRGIKLRDPEAAEQHKPSFVLDIAEGDLPLMIAAAYCWTFDIPVAGLIFKERECDGPSDEVG